MSSPNRNEALVTEYLDRVDYALRDLPLDRRNSLMEDIREHIRIARAAMNPEDEAKIRQLLDQMGDPEEIRAEAGLPAIPNASWGDRWAPWLLLLGSLVFIVGWLVGAILLWNSRVWNTRDKILATLVWPGGLLAPLVLGGFAASVSTTTQHSTTCAITAGAESTCAVSTVSPPGPDPFQTAVRLIILAALMAAPIVVNVRLIRIQQRIAAR